MIRKHLSYSNVAATIALVVALGTGGAYAASQIGSGEIKDNSIRSKDLKNRKAVKAVDVRRNGLTGREIREGTLSASQFAPLASDFAVNCDPTGVTFVECVAATIRLGSPGRLLVVATGDFYSEGAAATLDCRVFIDGNATPGSSAPGEATTDNTDLGATDGFARALTSARLAKGNHEVSLRCAQVGADDGRLGSSTIAVLGVAE